MTSDQIQEVIQYLINLGETMATSAYQLALKRTVFMGIQHLLWAVFFGVVLVASVRVLRKGLALKAEDTFSDWESEYYMGGVGVFLGLFCMLIFISGALDLFINPEWNAIKLILDFIE